LYRDVTSPYVSTARVRGWHGQGPVNTAGIGSFAGHGENMHDVVEM